MRRACPCPCARRASLPLTRSTTRRTSDAPTPPRPSPSRGAPSLHCEYARANKAGVHLPLRAQRRCACRPAARARRDHSRSAAHTPRT
jgi:hypothetical protein